MLNLQYQIISGNMKLRVVFILIFSIAFGSYLSGQKSNKKITISGYAVDANKYPVADAVIMIDNTKTNCVTDHNGFYRVKAKSSAQNIRIVTYKLGEGEEPLIIEEPINGITRINFTFGTSIPPQIYNMNNDSDEEEINIGYGTEKKKNLSSPVSKIYGTDTKYAGYNSIYDMLIEIPGVQISGNSIQIWGENSLISSNEPLYVIDGISVNSIDHISPRWVKSIEVLKGPSASIYGSRGANGVILINLLTYPD